MKMKFDHGKYRHRVVYIDYSNGIPHMVISAAYIPHAEEPYWRLHEWDFFANNGDKKDIRAYHSGSGGSIEDGIRAPQWADGHIGTFWIDPDVKLIGSPQNFKIIKTPRFLNGYFGKSRNPFLVSEICSHYEYCEECGCDSTETCWDHKYEDDEGDLRYKSNDEFCD